MPEWYGYTGKILHVDLTRETIEVRELEEEDADMFIGGVGLAAKIIVEEMADPRADPFSPENVLVFMTGPLTGTMVPCSGRYVVAAKSPLTLAWGEAHASGFWGVELKRAGFDGIVFKGKAKDPVYLYVHDGEAELRDASGLWGLDVYRTDSLLKEELGGSVRVATIGPAGERLVRYAVVAADVLPDGPRVAGRTGMGAVMGSKNLKAIAVRGSGEVRVKDPKRVRSVLHRLLPLILSSPTNQIHASCGTPGEIEEFYEYGDMPIKNFTLGVWDHVKKFTGENLRRIGIVKEHKACWACPIHCWKYMELDEEVKGRAPEYETLAALGSLLLIDDPFLIARANYLCNKYGIDTISTGVTIAWAMESFEKGLLTKEDTGGLEFKWGDGELLLKLIELIGRREGFGKILGEGCRLASKLIGRGTEKYCMHVKGLEVPMHDPRAFKGMGLQYATSNRGACHLQGYVFRIEQGERAYDLKIYDRLDRFEVKGKGWVVGIREIWFTVLESLAICKFIDIPPTHLAGLYSLITGRKKNLDQLLEAGRRIYNLQRMFNVANGITRKDDTLPERFLKEPLKEGGAKGQVVELEPMLDEYYEYMGWDSNGIPRREVLEELGILKLVERFLPPQP